MGHIFEQSPINILTKEKFMSKKVWLCSKFDCLVKKQEQVFLKAQVTKVCLELEDDDYFFVYPIGDGISYMVTMQNGQIVDNGHVLIEKLFDDEYSVILLPFFVCQYPSKSYTNKVGQFVQSVFVGKQMIYCLQIENTRHFCKLDFDFDDFKFVSFQNIPLLLAQGEQKRLVCFDNVAQKFCTWHGDVDIQKNQIKVVSPLCDIAHRANEIVLEAKDGNLVQKSCDLVYLEGKPIMPVQEGLIPFAFFQAVKAKDFFCAKSMLDESLDIQNQQVFDQYFGEFDKIKPYNYNREKGYFVALGKDGKNKIFLLELKNKKIVEIKRLERNNGVDKLQ